MLGPTSNVFFREVEFKPVDPVDKNFERNWFLLFRSFAVYKGGGTL